jgi:hypothetical protein
MLSLIVFILAAQFKLERLYSMRLKARIQTTLVLVPHDRIAKLRCGAPPARARLAGDGDFAGAFAGKPGSYRKAKAAWQLRQAALRGAQ